MNSADRQELAVLLQRVRELTANGFHPLETCPLLCFGLRLTLTELPVLGDHLAVAAVALTGVGAIAVYAAALSFTWVLVTLVHICNGRQRKKIKVEGEYKRSNVTLHCRSISPAETVHFPKP